MRETDVSRRGAREVGTDPRAPRARHAPVLRPGVRKAEPGLPGGFPGPTTVSRVNLGTVRGTPRAAACDRPSTAPAPRTRRKPPSNAVAGPNPAHRASSPPPASTHEPGGLPPVRTSDQPVRAAGNPLGGISTEHSSRFQHRLSTGLCRLGRHRCSVGGTSRGLSPRAPRHRVATHTTSGPSSREHTRETPQRCRLIGRCVSALPRRRTPASGNRTNTPGKALLEPATRPRQ